MLGLGVTVPLPATYETCELGIYRKTLAGTAQSEVSVSPASPFRQPDSKTSAHSREWISMVHVIADPSRRGAGQQHCPSSEAARFAH